MSGEAGVYVGRCESEWEPQEFFELVQRIRHDLRDTYEHDTLSESIAMVLERDHGFIVVSDDRLIAAVNVSSEESENFLADLGVEDDEDDDDEDEEEGGDQLSGDFKTILAKFDPDDTARLN